MNIVRPFYLLLIITMTSLSPSSIQAARVAEPYKADDLYKFGESKAFEPTVQLIDKNGLCCSASRVKLSENDPVDFYLTASHCLPHNEQEEEEAREVAPKSSDGINTIDINHVVYITHYHRDLALFTTGVKTDLPRYKIAYPSFEKKPLAGISVGYGQNAYVSSGDRGDQERLEKRQAFYVNFGVNDEGNWDASYLPSNEYIEGAPRGVVSAGDSGGSLLIEKEGEYHLVGVVEARRSSQFELGWVNGLQLLSGKWSWKKLMGFLGFNDDFDCYGTHSTWETLDKTFIKKAALLLSKNAPIRWSKESNNPFGFDLEINYSANFSAWGERNTKNILGYASDYTQLRISKGDEDVAFVSLRGPTNYTFVHESSEGPRQVHLSLVKDKKALGYEVFIRGNKI